MGKLFGKPVNPLYLKSSMYKLFLQRSLKIQSGPSG